MFKNFFNKKKAAKAPQEVIFKNTSCDVPRRVASQSGERDVTSWDEVEEAIRDMLADPEELSFSPWVTPASGSGSSSPPS